MELLTRDEFRQKVFERDNYRCVICGDEAQDAHHIMERRLFPDGGYYVDNGASLCEFHHIGAERTDIGLSPDDLRQYCGIKNVILPPHLYRDQEYDKWGNPVLPNGQRLRGELFDDPSVQKILSKVIQAGIFVNRVKYPRTYHLPWSPGMTKDDRMMDSDKAFEGKEVVAIVKMDGENTTMYNDYIHARALEYHPHPSRDRVKALHATIAHNIPEGWRVSGENMYAKHSIHYKNLPDFFLMFAIWNEKNECLSWDETEEWAELLGLTLCPVLWRGTYDRKLLENLYTPTYNGDECEGYVLRVTDSFHYSQFRNMVGKYVRKGHVHTQAFWRHQQIVPNEWRSKDGPSNEV